MIEQSREGFGEIQITHIEERFCEEARVEKMQDRMCHTADILIDRQPGLDRFLIEWLVIAIDAGVAKEIPR